MLQGHGDHVEADDEGNEDVQVVAGAHGVDKQPCGTVGGIVGQPLSFCGERGRVAQTTQGWTKQRKSTKKGETMGREEAREKHAGPHQVLEDLPARAP